MIKRLWDDEDGFIISMELVLVSTILVIGMIVGLKSVRDAVVTELADVGQAIANIDQSYFYSRVTGHAAASEGSAFLDARDFCDLPTGGVCGGSGPQSLGNSGSKCVNVCASRGPGDLDVEGITGISK